MPAHLDGNALAGPMSELFAIDITIATAVCGSCGDNAHMGQAMVYVSAMGHVARCRSCGDVLMVLVRTPAGTMLNVRGLAGLRITPSGA